MRPPRPHTVAIDRRAHAKAPAAPACIAPSKKDACASQWAAADWERSGRNCFRYTSSKSARFEQANSWKNCSWLRALAAASLSSSRAFWAGLRSTATMCSGPSRRRSRTLHPPVVSTSSRSWPPSESSWPSTLGSSHATL
eukprot:scaffold5420_cov27-Tisochrysis_lutea.AAC.2